MKPGNAERVVWAHRHGLRTGVALLYLHGFTASPMEAGLLPEQIAGELGANLYAHRWPGHGLVNEDAMKGLMLSELRASAHVALDTAKSLGSQVAIVGSSLGATLGLWLAATRPADVCAVAAWSPGIEPADPALLDLLCAAQEPVTDPRPRSGPLAAYWSATVHPDGYRALRALFEDHRADPPWPRVRCPVFLGFSRGPDGDEDQTASVPAMLAMYQQLGIAPEHREAIAYPAGAHVIGSPFKSPLAVQVASDTVAFLATQLAGLSAAGPGR